MEKITYRVNGKGKAYKLIVESREYIDTIYKISPLIMTPEDALEVAHDTNIVGYTDGWETSKIKEQFSYIFKVTRKMKVRFIRFTKSGDKTKIQIFSTMPKNIYLPKRMDAKCSSSQKT